MKKCYLQPEAEWIKLISCSVITESVPGTENDETSPLTFGKSSYSFTKQNDSYIY